MTNPAIVWLRQDLRLSDNPALDAAAKTGRPLILVYILDDAAPNRWKLGGASRWWLHHSLAALSLEVKKRGGSLVLRRGDARSALPALVRETGTAAVFWNRQYEPCAIARDTDLKDQLTHSGVEVTTSNGSLLFEPWTVKTKSGEPFKVFTPFWRACMQCNWRAPLPAPHKLPAYSAAPESDALASWALSPTKPNWATGFTSEWNPGEVGAHKALARFVELRLSEYAEMRDQLGSAGTSRLSPHLHFGEISPSQVRRVVEGAVAQDPRLQRGADKFLAELGWREFSTSLLYHWPTLPSENWRKQFDAFPWRDDEPAFRAWRRGETGYPVVDAAMRELWTTGYMHNRARMIAASFLTKHLMIDWRRGEEWFWDTLVDADLANNSASWQWVAGTGADAAPYFRIFNPVSQGERYDADGWYVRRWIPELGKLPDSVLHKPWAADKSELRAAGVRLGEHYPMPIVDHGEARGRALSALDGLKKAGPA